MSTSRVAAKFSATEPIIVAALCSVAFSLVAGQWAKPEPIPREKGLHRCQIHRGGGHANEVGQQLYLYGVIGNLGLGYNRKAGTVSHDLVASTVQDPAPLRGKRYRARPV